MIARFRTNLPGTPAVRGDACRCPFNDASFDAAISWGMIFHLPHRDQATAFASISRVLKPGALFLFTAAEIDDAGITGTMNGVGFHYTRCISRNAALFTRQTAPYEILEPVGACGMRGCDARWRIPG
jgi:ubiquinone/menaquinone biosynthesis C-methylase UbiE